MRLNKRGWKIIELLLEAGGSLEEVSEALGTFSIETDSFESL